MSSEHINEHVISKLTNESANNNLANKCVVNECIVDVHIEISKNGHVKYEFDHHNQQLLCDRILHVPFAYPFNYGYIPKTLSLDADPIDAVVVCKAELYPTCYIKCKIIGVLVTEDEKGGDDKLILVPCDKVDPHSKDIHDITDLGKHEIEEIRYFFGHYKDLEDGKWVVVKELLGASDAINIYKESIERYEYATTVASAH